MFAPGVVRNTDYTDPEHGGHRRLWVSWHWINVAGFEAPDNARPWLEAAGLVRLLRRTRPAWRAPSVQPGSGA